MIQSGQRPDTNSANDGSTNKLETNGYSSTQQQMYTNNQGKLTNEKIEIFSNICNSYNNKKKFYLLISTESFDVNGRTLHDPSLTINDDNERISSETTGDEGKEFGQPSSNIVNDSKITHLVHKTSLRSSFFSRLFQSELHVRKILNQPQLAAVDYKFSFFYLVATPVESNRKLISSSLYRRYMSVYVPILL